MRNHIFPTNKKHRPPHPPTPTPPPKKKKKTHTQTTTYNTYRMRILPPLKRFFFIKKRFF